MNLKEDIRSISYIKAHAAEILKQLESTRRPIFVTQNGVAKAVLLDAESYEKMKKALGILKIIAQREKDVKKGEFLPQDVFFASLEKKLQK